MTRGRDLAMSELLSAKANAQHVQPEQDEDDSERNHRYLLMRVQVGTSMGRHERTAFVIADFG